MTSEVPNKFWERIGGWAAISLLALSIFYVQKLEARIEKTEASVLVLSMEKVSRQEMKELEDRLRSDVASVKSEIIERLDWHFGYNNKSKK